MSKDSDKLVALNPAEKQAVGVVALVSMLRLFSLFALLPVLSLYAAKLDGATPILIGMAVGAYGLTQAGLQIPFGALSDRIGRMPVLLGGLAILAMGSVFAAVSETIWGVIAGRMLQGAGAISATLTALLADATRDEVRTRSMAVFGIGVGASLLLALFVGPLLAGQFGVRALFWLGAVLAVVAASSLLMLPDIEQPRARQSWSVAPAFRPDLLRLDFYIFLLHAILTASFVALPFLLSNELELALEAHWQMYVGALLMSLLIAVPMIVSDERQGKSRNLRLAVTLIAIAQLVLTFAGFAVAPVFVGLVLFFAGFTFLEAGLPARLSLLADGNLRGASLGVYSSAMFLGAFAGGLIGGRFLAAGRPADVFFVCALLAAIWLAVGARQR